MAGTGPVLVRLDQWPRPRTAATMSNATVRPTMPMISVATAVLFTRVVTRVDVMIIAAWMASTTRVSSAALVGVYDSPISGWNATWIRP